MLRNPEALYGDDFEGKNGGLRPAPIFETFSLIYQYHNLDRLQIKGYFLTFRNFMRYSF